MFSALSAGKRASFLRLDVKHLAESGFDSAVDDDPDDRDAECFILVGKFGISVGKNHDRDRRIIHHIVFEIVEYRLEARAAASDRLDALQVFDRLERDRLADRRIEERYLSREISELIDRGNYLKIYRREFLLGHGSTRVGEKPDVFDASDIAFGK